MSNIVLVDYTRTAEESKRLFQDLGFIPIDNSQSDSTRTIVVIEDEAKQQ